jgi:hypothetical protein
MDLKLKRIQTFISHYIPDGFTFHRFKFLLRMLYSLAPLLRLHLNQYTWGGQPPRLEGAWFRGMSEILLHAARPELLQPGDADQQWPGSPLTARRQQVIERNLETILQSLRVKNYSGHPHSLPVLCTRHLNCIFCKISLLFTSMTSGR